MHPLGLHLAPVLAAEKSKVAFYVAGGVLIVWALGLSLGVGLRRPDFPSSAGQQRAIMAVSGVLVLAAVTTAVLTSSGPAKGPVPPGTTQAQAPIPVVSQPVPTSAAGAATQTPSATSTSGEAPSSATKAATSSTSAPSITKSVTALKLAANPTGLLQYNTKSLSAKAGTVMITMTNMSPLEHNVTVAQGSKVLGATPTFIGGTRTLTLTLKPGRYTFYCSVPGHRAAGMEGTLEVS